MTAPSQSRRPRLALIAPIAGLLLAGLWALLVLRAAPAMGDAWGTPIQALIRARTPCAQPALACLGEFLQLTAHNDSVNLVPSLAELLHTSLLGRWTITASRLLGIAGWWLILLLLFQAQRRLHPQPSAGSRALQAFWLFLFSLAAGLDRFAAAFAIHRTLPAFCSVAAALLLWVPLPDRLQRHQLPLLGGLCLISLFSFANGGLLFVLVAGSLALQRRRQWRAIALTGLLALGPYLALFKWKHAAAMQAGADPSLAQSLLLFFNFSTWPLQQALTGLSRPELILALPLALLIGVMVWRGVRDPSGPSEPSGNGIAFHAFLLVTYLPVPLLVALQRGYTSVPERYYVEVALFSAAGAGLLFELLQRPRWHRCGPPLAGLAVALLALNSARLILIARSGQSLPGPQGLRCLKSSSEISPATVERCGVAGEYLKWKKRPDPAWRAAYARGLNSVLLGR